MSNLKLNETPVRTSRNFIINNIKLENIEIPENIKKFDSFTVLLKDQKELDKINSEVNNSQFSVNSNVSKINLKYGLDDFFTNQVELKANFKAKIEAKSNKNDILKYSFNFDENNRNLVENIEIKANEGTRSTIVLEYNSTENGENFEYYHNGIIRAKVCKNAVLDIVLMNFLNDKSNNFISIQNEFEDNSKINFYIIDFGGKNSITNYYSNISGENADNQLNTIYLGKNEQLFDLNYIGELYGKKSNIDIEVQGALKGNSKKHFKGTIDFKKGCKKATGNENENCILLSDKAKSISLPMLLCSEEQVEGNHSSSAGKIGEKELFYIMSRGFDPKAGMKLMVRAKFDKILENITDESLKNKILYEIDKRLD